MRAGKGLGLPNSLAAVLWRSDELGTPCNSVLTTGFDALDHELPGGGWPIGCATVPLLSAEAAGRIVAAREQQPFDHAEDLARRAGLDVHEMRVLAAADALMSLSGRLG